MSFYNKGVKYNFKMPDGGGMYNSALFIVVVYDVSAGSDAISSLLASIFSTDSGAGSESVLATVTLSPISDAGTGNDSISLTSNIDVSDTGIGDEGLFLTCQIAIADTGIGQEIVGIAKTFFIIDSDSVLQPLGVLVLQDSRYDLVPPLKEYTDEIPGRHGEINFGNKLDGRLLELHVASVDGLAPEQKEALKRDFAKYLNPVTGAKNLIFSDDIEKTYTVKYAGKIDLTQYADWMEFVIPFKIANPYIIGSFEKKQTGSGALFNSGNVETPVIIQIAGAITNPSITFGAYTLTYTGIIPDGQTLVVDTEKKTVMLNGANALNNWSGGFPKLQPGNTSVTADNKVTFIWRERWV